MNPTDLLTSVAAHIDPRYGTGTTKVWYMKPDFFRDGNMGHEWLVERNLVPSLATIEKTHTLVGTLDVSDPEDAYQMMQGENWSPRGEARGLIAGLGLQHTSMSVGDIVESAGVLFLVEGGGFKRLP
jgi:hypothetical protein